VICSWCEERFERLLDGDLTAAERARVLAHVDGCAGCRSLLDELRVVDALLLQPSPVEPTRDFTAATMADVRALPPPVTPRRDRWRAYLVCYVVGAWSLIAAGFVLARRTMVGLGQTVREVAQTTAIALAGVLHVALHVGDRGEVGSWTTLAGGVVLADLMLVLGFVAARRYAAPWFGHRQRS